MYLLLSCYIKRAVLIFKLTYTFSYIASLAEEYADKHRISKTILRPKYNLYHRAAPLKRNDEMVEMSDSILVIWDGVSKGTKHTIDYANNVGKKVNVVIHKQQ